MDYNVAFTDPDFRKAYNNFAKCNSKLMNSLMQHGVDHTKAVKLVDSFENTIRQLRDEEINCIMRSRRLAVRGI